MKKHRMKILLILVFFVAISSFMYFDAFATLTSYESKIDANSKTNTAKFNIKVNDTNVYTEDGSVKNIDLTKTITNNAHIASDKVAPGAKVSLPLKIDITGSEVAIKFEVKILDKSVDEDKVLTLMSVNDDSSSVKLKRSAKDTYTGLIKLTDLDTGVFNYTLNFEFIDKEIVLEESLIESQTDDLFEITFNAVQYLGETINTYTGE